MDLWLVEVARIEIIIPSGFFAMDRPDISTEPAPLVFAPFAAHMYASTSFFNTVTASWARAWLGVYFYVVLGKLLSFTSGEHIPLLVHVAVEGSVSIF